MTWFFGSYVIVYILLIWISRRSAEVYKDGPRTIYVKWNAWLPHTIGTRGPGDGISIFGVIWFEGTWATTKHIAHEARHIWQERMLGYVLYPLAILISLIIGRGHDGSWMERDADRWAKEHESEFFTPEGVWQRR